MRAAVHRKETAERLGDVPVETIVGDILDRSAVTRSVDGVWAVVHLAAMIKGIDKGLLQRTNVEGTANIIGACREKRIRRVIFISTPRAISPVSTAYGESKREAEELIRSSSLDWTIFRPVLVYGPGDTKDLTRVADAVYRWPVVPVLGNGRFLIQPVYIDDLVQSIVRALENDVSIGKVYDVAGMSPLSFDEFISAAAGAAGKKCYRIHIPLNLAMIAAYILEKVSRNPLLTRDIVRGMALHKTGDVGPLHRDLGVSPKSAKEGLRALFAARA